MINMASTKFNNIRLGIFVLSGLVFLLLALYFIGKDENIFGSNFRLKARFSNASGLVPGNNVMYSGIQVGTVKKVDLINDTLIEVTMAISEKARTHILKNAIASIGTEGFIGNKILNIQPGEGTSLPVEQNDILSAKKVISTDDMLETLALTNRNLVIITENLKSTVQRINNSDALWKLLNDKSLPENIRQSAENIKTSTVKANDFIAGLQNIITDVQDGKGSLGAILKDTSFAVELNQAIQKIILAGENADTLANEIKSLTTGIKYDLNNGKGVANALLKDSLIVQKIYNSLSHIEMGTSAFNENMEALKHNFLLRGYFRKLEKQKESKNKK
jgi:phospholipid/cholesterol/gamma-HCH transport system substrate-binding protein